MATIKSRRSGPWDDPKTWAGGRVPKSGDTVIIRSGTTVTPSIKTKFRGGTVQIEDGAMFDITKSKINLGLKGGVSPGGGGVRSSGVRAED
jgi:hypothetical protein